MLTDSTVTEQLANRTTVQLNNMQPTASISFTASTTSDSVSKSRFPPIDWSSNAQLLTEASRTKPPRNPMHSHDSVATSGWGIDQPTKDTTIIQRLRTWLSDLYFRYELQINTYMLESWEKCMVNAFIVALILALLYVTSNALTRTSTIDE